MIYISHITQLYPERELKTNVFPVDCTLQRVSRNSSATENIFSESHKGTLVNSNTRPLEAEVDKTDGQFNGSTVWRLGGKQFHRNVTRGRGFSESLNNQCFSCVVAEMDVNYLFAPFSPSTSC